MTKRIDAITKHWAAGAKWRGGEDAKKFRGNLKRAATAAQNCADLFHAFDGEDRLDRAEDIKILLQAATLMAQLADDFEVAQRKADRVKKDEEKKRAAEREAALKAAALTLFGTNPDPEAVLALGADLLYFDGPGADEFARSKGYDRGLFAGTYGISDLRFAVQRKDAKACARLIADNYTTIPAKGYPHTVARDNERWWHAGWPDFIEWRKVREQVRNVCTPAGDPE